MVVARRYHLHAPGIVYTVISVLIVLGAINGQNNLLFWAFGLAVAGMLISGFVSGAVLMGVQVRREPIYPTDAGSPLLVRYTIRNKNRWIPGFALSIEELEAPKRRRGSPATWFKLMSRPVAFVPHVPPKGVVLVETTVTPWARGRSVFEAFRVSTTFPFGLTFKSVVFVQKQDALIRPWRPELLPGAVRRILAASGHADRSLQRRGSSEETFALRDYRSGESTRNIAWKPTARHGRLIVREQSQRSPASVSVVVGGASSPQARERVISLAASIAMQAAASGLEIGVLWPEAGISIPASASPGAASRVLDVLASGDEIGATSLAAPSADRTTKIVVHEGQSMFSASGSVLLMSVDDSSLVDPGAWNQAPGSPGRSRASTSPSSTWERVTKLLGRLG